MALKELSVSSYPEANVEEKFPLATVDDAAFIKKYLSDRVYRAHTEVKW